MPHQPGHADDLAGAGVDAGDHLSDRNFGYPFADQANGGTIRGMLEAIDLIEKLAGPNTTLVPGHGTLVKKGESWTASASITSQPQHGTSVRARVPLLPR